MKLTKDNIIEFYNSRLNNGVYVSRLITNNWSQFINRELTDDDFKTLVSFMTTNGILVKTGDDYEIIVNVDLDDTPIIEYTAPEEISKDWMDDPEVCESHDFEKKPEESDGKGEIKLVKAVKELPIEAFKQTDVKTIKLPVLTKISKSMFEECKKLTKIDIPKEVKVIEQKAFKECTVLTKVVLNEGLQTIEESAFEGCTELNNINIPDTVETIGDNAFTGDENIPDEIHEQIIEVNPDAIVVPIKYYTVYADDLCTSTGENEIYDENTNTYSYPEGTVVEISASPSGQEYYLINFDVMAELDENDNPLWDIEPYINREHQYDEYFVTVELHGDVCANAQEEMQWMGGGE